MLTVPAWTLRVSKHAAEVPSGHGAIRMGLATERCMVPAGDGAARRKAGARMTPDVEVSEHAELTTDQARQGETGHHVRYVLAIGTVLAVAALAMAVIFAFS